MTIRTLAGGLGAALTLLAGACDPIDWPEPAGGPPGVIVCDLRPPQPRPEPVLPAWFARASRGEPETRVAVTARPAVQDGKTMVAFTIRNVSRQPIELWPHELPWGNAYAIDVVAVDTAGRLLERILPIDDPGPAARLRLEPGASRSGLSDLATVQDLAARLRRSAVIVYWSYKLDLGQPAVTTGVVILPRRTP